MMFEVKSYDQFYIVIFNKVLFSEYILQIFLSEDEITNLFEQFNAHFTDYEWLFNNIQDAQKFADYMNEIYLTETNKIFK